MPSIVLISADLMTSSRVASAATAGGITCRTALNIAKLGELIDAETSAVVFDLSTAGARAADVVAAVRKSASSAKVIAFGPHVHEALLASAAEAGCDSVVSRGEFFARLPELLQAPKS